MSAVIIAGNEEKNIHRCVSSLLEVADEIVVVDSYSTDETVKIATSLGATVYKNAFAGYVEQKNVAITCAKNQWILSLDADEALSPELKESLLELKNKLDPKKAYSFNRLSSYCGQWIKHCGWYPDVKLRLFHKSAGKWGGKNPHDKFMAHSSITVEHLKGDLLHYTFYSIEQHKAQIAKFSSISAQAYFDKGLRSNVLRIIFSPVAKFVRNYILKKGFLDGYYGWLICILSAKATYLKYVKLKKIQEGKIL